jgi:hypothetical protein
MEKRKRKKYKKDSNAVNMKILPVKAGFSILEASDKRLTQ